MRTIATLLILATLAGCVRVERAPDTQPTLAADVFDATTAYLLARPERAESVIETAGKIKAAALSGVDANTLRTLALNLILDRAGMDDDQRAAAAFLANVLISRVQRKLGIQIDVELVPDGHMAEAKRIVVEACDAAIRAAKPFVR